MPSSNPGGWVLVPQGTGFFPIDSKVTGVHAVLMHTGKILYFHMRYFPALSACVDPLALGPDAVTEQVPPFTDYSTLTELHAMFCGAQIVMDDGKVFVAGGEIEPPPDIEGGLKITFIYDPDASSDRWSQAGGSSTLTL
jgi:hypothetical protein